ncbi:NAD(P)-binding protein [Cryphonectria parasitica EP155]|uniref:NAD(P)-binding protein n=1 Tax=Cryphonectria parasitica (strain ATCC 38755 / EP155) TaxID=660469 RepID=A0A9P4XXY4_CRYP1|nr:NAD(P)-binding protein [Cryphonectria parasitica EP155]KAF3763048.1 NAD(P)-binding protein [Cryphonectria parasitica EP155]
MTGTKNLLSQFLCPAKPTITEEYVPDLKDKVVIVTGSNTGLGKEIARIMYAKNAKVYMMARSEDKTRQAMNEIRAAEPKSAGELHFIRLDLADLTTIQASADAFLAREPALHLLFNNAGVGYPDKGAVTAQGHELQLGVNCVGPWGLTRLLTPALLAAAAQPEVPSGSVRVVWVSSSATEAVLPKNLMKAVAGNMEAESAMDRYGFSKLGNYLHAAEFAERHRADGILSVSLNPGALDSDFWRSQGGVTTAILRNTLLHPPVYGAYTSLFAAFSSEITAEKSGCFVAPWGQFWNLPKDYVNAVKTEAEGGTGIARQFWEWTEAQWKPYL